MKEYFEFLLSDETNGISFKEFEERSLLVSELEKVIDGKALGKIRHFQPQIGCLNLCSICSKHASSSMSWWDIERQRNVIAAIKHIASKYKKEKPYISWDRDNHRNGVIFSYLDNDIGNYYYLDSFIKLMYDELGVTTRISTVGYSRHNEYLNKVHSNINRKENLEKIGGFRVSFTPYAIGWKCENRNYSRFDYIFDIANILKIYKPYFNYAGSGSRNMCVELRYRPLVVLGKVYDKEILGHKVIASNNHIYISKGKNVSLGVSHIAKPHDHMISLSEEPIRFYDILNPSINSDAELESEVINFISKGNKEACKLVSVYKMENADGHYYAVEPSINDEGNYGVNIFPITNNRINSGVIITERFVLNAILKIKHEQNISALQKFELANWQNVYDVLDELQRNADKYRESGEVQKANYIMEEVFPMLEGYIQALQHAEYDASSFFDPDFSIDTGIICNMGGALREFKGITFLENEPLTPTHERNYGRHTSTMTVENEVLRVSCDYNNRIVVQQLNLSKTATREGQIEFSKTIALSPKDEEFNYKSLEKYYLVPGQRRNF